MPHPQKIFRFISFYSPCESFFVYYVLLFMHSNNLEFFLHLLDLGKHPSGNDTICSKYCLVFFTVSWQLVVSVDTRLMRFLRYGLIIGWEYA